MMLGQLADSSRVWMFGAQRRMTDEEVLKLRIQLQQFVAGWQAHGVDLLAGFDVLFNTIVVVAVDETKEPPSGCSIDKVFHLLKSQQEIYGLDFFQRTLLWVQDGVDLCIYNPGTLKEKYDAGLLTDDSLVVDMLPNNLGVLREGLWQPLSESWIGRRLNREKQST
jgi:hypothetical protein